jgi:SAM-dependent methyltransferase
MRRDRLRVSHVRSLRFVLDQVACVEPHGNHTGSGCIPQEVWLLLPGMKALDCLNPYRLWMLLAWELRARRNAMHYIADFRKKWTDPDEFFATGRDDVESFLADAGWGETADKSLLEIGCGIGRMSRHLASRFGRVLGIDISPAMISAARELHRGYGNLEFQVGSGVDLSGVADASFDFVISYIVFQHIPKEEIIYRYIDESLRVLKPDGRIRFQARNDLAHSRPTTYRGASVHLARVREIAATRNAEVLSVTGEGTWKLFVEMRAAGANPR